MRKGAPLCGLMRFYARRGRLQGRGLEGTLPPIPPRIIGFVASSVKSSRATIAPEAFQLIPQNITDLAWDDIERLVEGRREEDDTIEFKVGFKGGDDYAALNDKAREQALDALAREALAFLNTRGGDLVIGVEEERGPRPVASSAPGILNPDDAADRIARGLAALIEPAQTNIAVRSVINPSDPTRGAILVRVQPSVRAPHRSKRTRNCYVRRGSESVPMAMDEIQDLTLYRSRLRLEQSELLDRQFTDFIAGKAQHRYLGTEIFHVRTVVFPYLEQSLKVDDEVLVSLGNRNPVYYDRSGQSSSNDVAFRGLYGSWKPVLRGKKRESFDEIVRGEHADILFACKIVKESGICIFDFAATAHFDDDAAKVHFLWLAGYFAEVCADIGALAKVRPTTLPATVRIGVRTEGDLHMAYGSGIWGGAHPIPPGTNFFPDFTISEPSDLNELFQQAQVDLFSLFAAPLDHPFSLEPPPSHSQ